MKLLVTPRSFGKTDPYVYTLLEEAGFTVISNDTGSILTEAKLKEYLQDCDGVILGVDPLSADVIASAPKLRAVAKYGVGIDNIDMEACAARNIKVSRTLGANTQAVADFAFALMLSVGRNVVSIDAKCRQGDWTKVTSLDVFGKTLGLIGLGAIGKAVAMRAKGFQMDILGYDPFWDDSYASSYGIRKSSLDEIYAQSDFISLHVPLTDQTKGMISHQQIQCMKSSAILVNTARGGIIDEDALLQALQEKRIYGAGMDAFSVEPPNNPAWYALDNVIIGSHCAASTHGATQQMGRMAVENIIADLNPDGK